MPETQPDPHIVPLSQIAPDVWDAVAAQSRPCPMSRFDWIACTAATAGERADVKIVTAGDPAHPQALLPLLVEPGPLRRHRFIGNDDGGVTMPARSETALAALARAAVSMPTAVNFGYYPAASPAVDLMRRAGRGRAFVLARPQARPTAPFLQLNESWQTPERHLKKKMAQSIRRRERRLRELGEVRIEFLEPCEAEVDGLIDTAARIESLSWKRRTGTALLQDRRQLDFLRRYGRTLAVQGRLHLTFIYLDDRPVAMSVGEIFENVYWAHKTGYDETYAKQGPGVLLQYHLIRHLAGRGVERLEFCGQMDDFKRAWTQDGVATVTLRVYPFTLRGMAALGADVTKPARRAVAGWWAAHSPHWPVDDGFSTTSEGDHTA